MLIDLVFFAYYYYWFLLAILWMVPGLVLSQGSNSNGNMKVSLKNPIIARDTNLIYFPTILLFAH